MTDEQKKALRVTIDYLDDKMRDSPNRQLADVSNYLETMYEEENKKK